MTGRIVILNGAPRSGKTTLARAIQTQVPGRWIHFGVDAFNASLPPALMPGIGLRPGGERPDLEANLPDLFTACFSAIAGFAAAGFDVVSDLGLQSDYVTPFDPMALLEETLGRFPLLLVGVHCDIDIIMAPPQCRSAGWLLRCRTGYSRTGPALAGRCAQGPGLRPHTRHGTPHARGCGTAPGGVAQDCSAHCSGVRGEALKGPIISPLPELMKSIPFNDLLSVSP